MIKNLFDSFTPKRIILNAIKDKLEGTGIKKLVLVFNIKTDKYNVMLSMSDDKSMKLNIEQDEITMLKKLFVTRIHKKFQEQFDNEVKCIILQIELEHDDFKIFIEDIKDEVILFNY